MEHRKMNRRGFLRSAALAGSAAFVAACAPRTVEKVVEKVVKETVVVEQEKEVTPVPKPKGRTSIYFLTQSVTPDTLRKLEPLIKRFEEENPDIHVAFAVQPGQQNIYEKMVIMHQGGTPADMACWANKVAIYACAGVFRDLQSFVDRDKFDVTDYYDSHVESLRWKGDLYALPAAVYTTVLYFNKDLFDKPGVPYPPQTEAGANGWTMEEFLSRAQKLAVDANNDGKPEQFGVHVMYMPNLNKPQFFGGYTFDEAGNCLMDSPESINAAQFFADLRVKNRVAPTTAEGEALSGGVVGAEASFLSGKVAMAIGGNWSLPAMMGAKFGWDVGILPSSAPEGNRSANFSPDAFVMGHGSNPEEVWRFLKWMQEPANIQEWCLTVGAFSPRKSQQDYNAKLINDKYGVTAEVFNYCLAHSTMVLGELRLYSNPNESEIEKLLIPHFDELDLGRITAEELIKRVIDEATAIAKKPC